MYNLKSTIFNSFSNLTKRFIISILIRSLLRWGSLSDLFSRAAAANSHASIKWFSSLELIQNDPFWAVGNLGYILICKALLTHEQSESRFPSGSLMVSSHNIFEEITSYENLFLAWQEFSWGKAKRKTCRRI